MTGTLLAVDVGTRHTKAALFDVRGALLRLSLYPTPTRVSPAGWHYYDPDELWMTVSRAIGEALAGDDAVAAVGVSSMAETGLLVDRETQRPRSPLLPWFDAAPAEQAAWLQSQDEPLALFQRAGLRASFKCGLARLLWLRDHQGIPLEDAVWLSAADYIAFRLTGAFATDYSLAGRTLAFDIRAKCWDTDWLERLGVPRTCFPDVHPAGTAAGQVSVADGSLPNGIPVTVAGHDHICAAFAVGVVTPGAVLDSMGTAEALVGALDLPALDQTALDSGLSFGCHTVPGRFYWIGATSAAGRSVEWLRELLADPPLSYDQIAGLLDSLPPDPTGLYYAPYLSGAGIPRPDPSIGAALIGLRHDHTRAHVLRAALEGAAYEIESIRELAVASVGVPLTRWMVVGGGTRNRHWLDIKADLSGETLLVPTQPEATLLGAALHAGVAVGRFADHADALRTVSVPMEEIHPDAERHRQYRQHYLGGYRPLQAYLRHNGTRP